MAKLDAAIMQWMKATGDDFRYTEAVKDYADLPA